MSPARNAPRARHRRRARERAPRGAEPCAWYLLWDPRSETAAEFCNRHGPIRPAVAARTIIENAHHHGAWEITAWVGLAGALARTSTWRLIGRAEAYARMFPGREVKAPRIEGVAGYSYIEGDEHQLDAARRLPDYLGHLAAIQR